RKAKGRITEKDYQEKLKEFDLITQSKIQNETSKEIEKAYLYSFNFQTYKSDLSNEQIKEWKEVLKDVEPENNLSIDEKYERLKMADMNTAVKILAGLNPENALEMDIARDVLNKLPQENEKIKKLQEILRKGQRYPYNPLDEYIIPVEDKIKPSQYPEKEFIVLGVANDRGVFISERKKGEEINQAYYIVRKGYFCYNPYRVNVGSIGLNEYDFENQIISGAYNIFKIDEKNIEPKYLFALFKSRKFLDYVNELATGGVRMDFKIDYLEKWKIPLPPLEIQKEIVQKIEKQKAIIEGAEKILEAWEVEERLFHTEQKAYLKDVCILITDGTHQTPTYSENGIKFLSATNVSGFKLDFENAKHIPIDLHEYFKKRVLPIEDDILLAKNGTIGACKIVPKLDYEFSIYVSLALLRPNKEKIVPKFLLYALQLTSTQEQFKQRTKKHGGVGNLHLLEINEVVVPLPPLEVQQKIVEELDREMEALEKLKLLKEKAEKRIEEILDEVWGEENN
ncbi:MAG: restriction endonuclease subunit S, partial [Minisyncoccia bacterium]